MKDLGIRLPNSPGSLATMGEALGRAGVSVEGGGAWVVGGMGEAHFLVDDARKARAALVAAGLEVVSEDAVVLQRLRQDRPGQLGALARRMADAGVNIRALYSDHQHQLVLVVNEPEKAGEVSAAWERERGAP